MMTMKHPVWSIITLVAMGVAIVGCPTLVSVPNVVGMTQLNATETLVDAGFLVTVSLASSDTVAQGNVISQNPVAATQAASGTTVTITVSQGPSSGVIVPQVVGQTIANATTALQAVGLTLGTQTTQSSTTVSSGIIISQTPVSGTNVAAASAVNVVVSSGPPTVAIPNLVGKTTLESIVLLNQLQLVAGTITYEINNQPAGIVISQSPAFGGSPVLLGTTVNIVASSGPTNVLVPVLVGKTEAEATVALSAVGLVLGTVTEQYDSANVGRVIAQAVTAGTSVPVGTQISMTLGCDAPNVVGMAKANAIATLAAVGITCEDPANITQTVMASPAIGIVTAQSIVGDVATLTVSSRQVPALAGKTKTEIDALLTNGLSLGDVSYAAIALPTNAAQIATIGKFASSTPAPATIVSDETAVDVVINTTVAPNVLSMTIANANTAITSYGLTRVEGSRVATTTTTLIDKVAQQDPAAGSLMPADDDGNIDMNVTVNYYGVRIPNVTGLDEVTAMDTLNALAPGLLVVKLTHPQVATTDSQFAEIMTTSPLAGKVIGINGGGATDITVLAYGLDVATHIGVDLVAGTTTETQAISVLGTIKPASGSASMPYTCSYVDSSGGNEAKFAKVKTFTLNDTTSLYCTEVAMSIYGAPIANYKDGTLAAAQTAIDTLQVTYSAFPDPTVNYVIASSAARVGYVLSQVPAGPSVGTSLILNVESGLIDVAGLYVEDTGVSPNIVKGAVSLLEDFGVAPTVVWKAGGGVLIGKVIGTAPVAGTLVLNGAVITVNASGVLVPTLTGLTVANAITQIEANANLVNDTANDALTQTALVTSQTPTAGTYVAPGTTVTLSIATK